MGKGGVGVSTSFITIISRGWIIRMFDHVEFGEGSPGI